MRTSESRAALAAYYIAISEIAGRPVGPLPRRTKGGRGAAPKKKNPAGEAESARSERKTEGNTALSAAPPVRAIRRRGRKERLAIVGTHRVILSLVLAPFPRIVPLCPPAMPVFVHRARMHASARSARARRRKRERERGGKDTSGLTRPRRDGRVADSSPRKGPKGAPGPFIRSDQIASVIARFTVLPAGVKLKKYRR